MVDSVKKLRIDDLTLEGVTSGINVPILIQVFIAVFEVFLTFFEEPPPLYVHFLHPRSLSVFV